MAVELGEFFHVPQKEVWLQEFVVEKREGGFRCLRPRRGPVGTAVCSAQGCRMEWSGTNLVSGSGGEATWCSIWYEWVHLAGSPASSLLTGSCVLAKPHFPDPKGLSSSWFFSCPRPDHALPRLWREEY